MLGGGGGFRAILAALVLLGALLTSQQSSGQSDAEHDRTDPVRAVADEVLDALSTRDGNKLASFVHPSKGVRFSPSAFIDLHKDVVFSRDQVAGFWSDSKVYSWGHAEGSGEPIELTPAAYADRYILDRDYAADASVSVDGNRPIGTTANNITNIYPAGTSVEYFIEPSAGRMASDLDWSALRLVFEKAGGTWFLVAVIHDEWSP
jgi:hypothetical protein